MPPGIPSAERQCPSDAISDDIVIDAANAHFPRFPWEELAIAAELLNLDS